MQIAIIGCGNIGTGIAKRLSGHHEIFLFDRDYQWTKELEKDGFGKACQNTSEAIQSAEYIFLTVKPQNLKEISEQIKPFIQKKHVLISALAGTAIETLEKHFPQCQVIRMMPNLALLYGQGVIGLAEHVSINPDKREKLNTLLIPLGQVYWLPESKIDSLSALAGSGPAYICVMIEAMIEAGIAMGFNAKDAQSLVVQTVEGTLSLLKETGKHPAEIKLQITSPGGTTIAGLVELENAAVRGSIIRAFLAAYKRNKELALTSA